MDGTVTNADIALATHETLALRRRGVTPRAEIVGIVERVAIKHGFQSSVLLDSTRRDRKLSRARWEAVAEVYKAFPWMSYPQLGKALKIDHTTVMYALAKTGLLQKRLKGGGGGSLYARAYSKHIETLFAGIASALSNEAVGKLQPQTEATP